MRDVQIIRGAIQPGDYGAIQPGDELNHLHGLARTWIRLAEDGQHPYARIYDDLWPLNLAGIEAVPLPRYVEHILARAVKDLYPHGFTMTTSIILCTTRYPYCGQWHRDAPPYEDDTIVLLCVDGHDDLEYHLGGAQWTCDHTGHPTFLSWTGDCQTHYADLAPGDLCLLPAATWHRGHCSTHRITWHVRVGPKGNTMPESPPAVLPPMTLRRFIRRTVCTSCYYLFGNSTLWRKS